MIFIGDVHGKYGRYRKIMKKYSNTIQVGDMGVGFLNYRGSPRRNPPHYLMVAGNHRFIRGNHDNPSVCKRHSQCIDDGCVEGDMMFIGGALSVDKQFRREGFDYWENEELSYVELTQLLDKYIQVKPRVMVTHDCPEEIASIMCAVSGRKKIDYPSITRQALQQMLNAHSPELWVFGHWHCSFDQTSLGTRFVCLNELEIKDLS